MQNHQFQFKGSTKEYFGIWIVNVLLTMITFGIYGAWAKVRDKKYMYGNTFVDGHSFDYHATGKQIFIGRLIVGGALLALTLLNVINPILYLITLIPLFLLIPYLVKTALRFNARVSSYRNVRFDFVGTTNDAFVVYFLIPIATVFSLYLAAPFLTRAKHNYITNNARYGDRKLTFSSDIGAYYKAFFLSILMGIILFILVSTFLSIGPTGLKALTTLGSTETQTPTPEQISALTKLMVFLYLGLFLIFVPAALLYRAWIRNIHFNNAIIDDRHHMQSNVKARMLIWIVVSNTIVSVLSLGLMIPWARIRLTRYMASVTSIHSDGDLGGYASDVKETTGVISAEYADIEGFDIDIGI